MEVEGFLFQFCEVTSIGKNPQENLTFIHDNLKINKLSIYWLKTKSYVEKWRKFPINKFSQIIWRFKIQKNNNLQQHVPGLYLYFTPVQKFATQKKKT